MAWPSCIQYPDAGYHVTSRGNEKKPVYRDDHDQEGFLSTLGKVNEGYRWLYHPYCLINNHFHLIIETPESWKLL